jgi:cyclopropane fatty-acyl-phospholipid synthase-like methyltransferase
MTDVFLLIILFITLAIAISMFFFYFRTGVPPLSSSRSEIADIVALLKEGGLPEKAIIYELGSSWGALAIALSKAFPNAQIRGVEISPFPYWIGRFRTRNIPNITLKQCDLFKVDLKEADAVTCYLMIKSMPKLADHLDKMLKPGALVVPLAFWFRDRELSARRNGPGIRGEVALYRWPAQKTQAPETATSVAHTLK